MSNNESCEIPFEFNGNTENNFCVENEGTFQCNTSTGFSDCDLGKYFFYINSNVLLSFMTKNIGKGQFMHVKRGRRTNLFSTQLQFKTKIILKPDTFYRFAFNYLINYDRCDPSEIVLTVFLRDDDFFKQVLFNSQQDSTNSKNNRWNEYSDCFQVDERTYFLFIVANSTCDINQNEAFIAVDDISILLLNSSDLLECNDFRITTIEPTTVVSSEVSSLSSTEEITTLEPTQISTTPRPIGIINIFTIIFNFLI